MTATAPDKSKIHPMAYYYLGYFASKLSQPQKAAEYDRLAMAMPPDYVFTFQNEAIDVLRVAGEINPRDARARYYLGNVLYDWQPEEAAKAWEVSAAIDPLFALVHRNLATVYIHQKSGADISGAIAELEKAVASDRKYALHFKELDELYEQAAVPLERRLPLFEVNAAVVTERDDAQNRAIALKVALGKYDDAIQMMTGRLFAVAEGANLNVADHWTEAHLLRAEKNVDAKRYADALADLQAAGAIPPNLPLGTAGGGGATTYRSTEIAYWTGVTREAMGDHLSALASWNRAAAPAQSGGGRRGGGGQDESYFQALALQKVGQDAQAKTIFTGLVESGKNALQQTSTADAGRGGGGRGQSPRARLANAHYMIGLGYLGLGDRAQAKAELSHAVDANPDLLGARTALASIQEGR
jgi:tetratricopeptide (TPR) repeat protein